MSTEEISVFGTHKLLRYTTFTVHNMLLRCYLHEHTFERNFALKPVHQFSCKVQAIRKSLPSAFVSCFFSQPSHYCITARLTINQNLTAASVWLHWIVVNGNHLLHCGSFNDINENMSSSTEMELFRMRGFSCNVWGIQNDLSVWRKRYVG